jgi:hypothetical protein
VLGKIRFIQLFEHHDREPVDGCELTIMAKGILAGGPGRKSIFNRRYPLTG